MKFLFSPPSATSFQTRAAESLLDLPDGVTLKRRYSGKRRYTDRGQEPGGFSGKCHLSLAGNGSLSHTGGQDSSEKGLLLVKFFITIHFYVCADTLNWGHAGLAISNAGCGERQNLLRIQPKAEPPTKGQLGSRTSHRQR